MKKMLVVTICFLGYISSAPGQVNTQIKKKETNAVIQKSAANKPIIIQPSSTTTKNKFNAPQRKRPVLTFAERLKRDMNSGKRSKTFFAAIMHSYERILSGEPNKSEFDLALENALKRNEGIRATLTRILADYKTIPIEIRAKSMPFDLASLNSKVGLSFKDVQKLISAGPGFRGVIDTSFFEKPKMLLDGDTSGGAQSNGATLPFISSITLSSENAEKKIYLKGSFTSNTPIVAIHFEPAQGQLLDGVYTQWINGKKVFVIPGKVNKAGDVISSIIPAGLGPGKYYVSVRVQRSFSDVPVSNQYLLELPSYAYTFRMLTIKCLDESNPETFLGSNVTDEVRIAWSVFNGKGDAQTGMTTMYSGFDDGVERTLHWQSNESDDGGIFLRPPEFIYAITPGTVTSYLFVNAMLFEMDQDRPDYPSCGGLQSDFLGDLGMAGLDELDVQLYKERMSQVVDTYFWLCYHGSCDLVNEVRLSFSAGELQHLTNNDAGRYRGEMQFFNDDSMGSYVVTYEIRRYPL